MARYNFFDGLTDFVACLIYLKQNNTVICGAAQIFNMSNLYETKRASSDN
jgi:hypothetical protein